MDTVLSLIFLFLFLLIVGIVIYILLDYIQYKSDIDETLVGVDKKIEKTKQKFVSTSRYANDKTMRDKKHTEQDTTLTELKGKDEVFENSINDVKTSVQKNQENIINFDSALNNYFSFVDNGKAIQDQKMYEYAFTGINDSIMVKKRMDVLNGINMTASSETPVQICDNSQNCINVHVDNENQEFNIQPGSGEIKGMTVKSSDGDVMTKYDTQQNATYFGGKDENEAAMYIHNGKMYVNNINFKMKGNNNEVKSYGIDTNIFNNLSDQYQNVYNMYSKFVDNNQSQIDHMVQSVGEIVSNTIAEVQVHYNLNNSYVYETESGDVYTPSYTDQVLTLKFLSKRSLEAGDEIYLKLPVSDIGRFTSSGRADPSTLHTDGPNNLEKYYIEADLPINKSLSKVNLNTNDIIVSISNHVDPNTQFIMKIRGKNILETRSTMYIYGIATGALMSKKDRKNWNLSNITDNIAEIKPVRDAYYNLENNDNFTKEIYGFYK
jgi:hypothetical protein